MIEKVKSTKKKWVKKAKKKRTRPWSGKELIKEVKSISQTLEGRRNNGASIIIKSL